MTREVRIVIVGGASTTFTPGLAADLVESEVLSGATLVLYDIDAANVEVMGKLCRRLATSARANLTVQTTTELDRALESADFLITTVGVGGDAGWRTDIDIPRKFGVVQTVGDTVGPGGISRAQRMIPVLLEVARHAERRCPRAMLFNFTNPMSACCRALTRESTLTVVGLCHGLAGTVRRLARLLGKPAASLETHAAGINHLTWIDLLESDGGDLLPELAALAGDKGTGQPVSDTLFEVFGRYPSPGDRHVGEFFPYFLNDRNEDGKRWNLSTLDTDRVIAGRPEKWQRIHEVAQGTRPVAEFTGGDSEEVVPIIEALVAGTRHQTVGNLPNAGLIDNLPREAIVEVPVVVDDGRVRGEACGTLPTGIAAISTQHLSAAELSVQAALTGDRGTLLEAMLVDPRAASVQDCRRMRDELLAAHAPFLKQYR